MSAIYFSDHSNRSILKLAFSVCALICVTYSARAGDSDGKSTLPTSTSDGKSPLPTSTTEEQPEEYKNWIELGIGGLIINGDSAQFKQEHRMSGDVFGGIQDLHFEESKGKTTFTVDGHAIWDNNDYDVTIKLDQQGIGYIHAGFNEFRSWYDGNGGFFPPKGGTWFAPPIPEMHIDRGEAWVELGLRVPNWPEITFRYSREFRDGEKDSTIWGDTVLTGLPIPPPSSRNPTRKIAPAYRDIDETRDIVSFDAVKSFDSINTTFDLGMRYEHNDNNDKLQLERGAGQIGALPPGVAVAQRFITQHEDNNLDMYNGHILTETRLFNDSLWFTTGYSYTTLGSDLSGSRIIGTHYNAVLSEVPAPPFQNFDEFFVNLAGTSEEREHLFDINWFWLTPIKDLSAISAFRYTHGSTDSDAVHLGTTVQLVKGVPTFSTGLEFADTSEEYDNYAERLELRYTHIENWLFYGEGEWEEECGNVQEHEVNDGVDQGKLDKDTDVLTQKYTIGATWYPMARLDLASQYYYKSVDYNNTFHSELATPTDIPPVAGSERNQRLLKQDWTTNDANIRITFRPKIPAQLGSLSLVSRYDYRQTLVMGKWGVSVAGPPPAVPPAPPAIPTGTIFQTEHTALITEHVIGETLNWNPCPRFYLQATGNYVLNQTKTPAANIDLIKVGGSATTPRYDSPTIVNFRNDYWTVTGAAGFIIDDKTDFHADYTYYRAPDYFKNSRVALPYGDDATEHTVGATLTRQLTKQVRLSVKYTYFNYEDATYGGHNDYRAHSIFSTLQYRF